MSLEDWLWLPVGFLSLSFSTTIWKKARSGHRPDFFELSLAGAALYGAWNAGGQLWSSGHFALQAVAATLWWCAASPVLAWVWHGGHGRVRARLWKMATLLSCFIVGSAVGSFFLSLNEAVIGGATLTGIVAVLPWLRHRFRTSLQQWHRHRNQRRHARSQELPQRPEDRQLIIQLQKQVATVEREKQQQESALQKLREQQEKKAEQQSRRRQDILNHVRRIRHDQRSAMEQGHLGLHYHPSSYGFLLAEASRVLRAQIQRGERVPAIEADPFLFDVVDTLIAADDFEARYFHRAGARAISAVERYLSGEDNLETVRSTWQRLKLEPEQVAPEPLAEPFLNSLLEAWLEPHRKFQMQQWHLFNMKKHPDQGRLSDFLRTQGLEYPEAEQWQDCWNASPAAFVGIPVDPLTNPPRKVSLLDRLRMSWPS